ncbi:MAG: hypothetical protein HYY06_28010 [Deltaproteobacteria bacterium]|nr:hypothetical protein [Deltaproteobacteria bacterium]
MKPTNKTLLALVSTLVAGCGLDPMVEDSASALFECVRDGQNYCAVCEPAATDTAAELSAGCAAAVTPEEPERVVTERTGILHLTLSGAAHLGILGDQDVAETPVDFRARVFAEGNRLGVQLLRGIQNGREYELTGGTPTLSPVAANGQGDHVGDLVVPIDFGALGNPDLAVENNTKNANVHIRFRLTGGASLEAATGASGAVESLHVEDVRIAAGGGRIGISIDLSGPVSMTFDALPAVEPVDPVGTPDWRDCMRFVVTRDCCVGAAVFDDVLELIATGPANLAELRGQLTPPNACAPVVEEEEPVVEEEEEEEEPEEEPELPVEGHDARAPIALGAPPVTREAGLVAGAEDWYSVQIAAAGRYSFETSTGPRGDDAATDTDMGLYPLVAGAAGPIVAGNEDDGEDGAGARIEVALEAGTYLVRIVGHRDTVAGLYTLAIGAAREDVEEEEEEGPPDERALPDAPYAVAGTRLFCDSGSADDVACWNNVNRQVVGGRGLRGQGLRSISWEMDASARLSESLEVEVYLIYGVGPRYGRVIDETRQRVRLLPALESGDCVERGDTITCTATYAQTIQLPETGEPGDDWFILELVGRDRGEVAPDGSWACGRFPQRVAANPYQDPTVELGGYVQLHNWANQSCGFSYGLVGNRADIDLAATIEVD